MITNIHFSFSTRNANQWPWDAGTHFVWSALLVPKEYLLIKKLPSAQTAAQRIQKVVFAKSISPRPKNDILHILY